MAHALAQADWVVTARLGRTDDLRVGVQGADVVIIATPDDVIADVSASLVGATDAAVIHLSGSLGLEGSYSGCTLGACRRISVSSQAASASRSASGGGI